MHATWSKRKREGTKRQEKKRKKELLELSKRRGKRKRKIKFKKKLSLLDQLRATGSRLSIKAKAKGLALKEHDKIIKQISSRVPIPIMSHTFIQNVPSCLDRI